MSKYWILLLLIPLLYISPVYAGNNNINEYIDDIYKEYSTGDYHKLYDSIERLIRDMPHQPETSLYLSDLVDLVEVAGQKKVENTLNDARRKMTGMGDFPGKGNSLMNIDLSLEELLYNNDTVRASKVTDSLSPLRVWQLIGPLSRYGPGDLYYPFIPEKTLDVSEHGLERRNIVIKTLRGELDMKRYLYPEGGIAYAVTSFPVSGAVKIRVFSESYYKVFVNGEESLVNEPGNYKKQRVLLIKDAPGISIKIKLYCGKSWKCRVMVSDVEDKPLAPQCTAEEKFTSPCMVREIEEYPFDEFTKLLSVDPFRAHVNLALYFSGMGSLKSIDHFNEALDIKEDRIVRYFLAAEMISLSEGDRNSSLYSRGWRMVSELARAHPGFIPASGKLLERGSEGAGLLAALRRGKGLLQSAPDYLPSCLDYADLLNQLGYERDFQSYIDQCKERFPFSQYLYLHEASFYRTRNREHYLNVLENALDMRYHYEIARRLLQEYIDMGAFDKARKILKKFNRDSIFAFEEIALEIKSQNYSTARSLLLREVAQRNHPLHYYNLGFITYEEQGDPMMYWLKSLSLKPSFYSLSDYITYLNEGIAAHACSKYLTPVDPVEFARTSGDAVSPATVLLREYIYDIKVDGSCRAFCRDIIKINTEEGADKWGEYPIPFKTEIQPLRVRVYNGKDKYSDYFKVQRVNASTYLTLSAVKKDSVVEISYITGELSRKKRDGIMMHVPCQIMQDYDEPVNKFRFTVIAPENLQVYFSHSSGMTMERSMADGDSRKVYKIEAEGLKSVSKEYFSGPPERNLPFVSFTIMKDEQDFNQWYTGHIKGKDELSFYKELPSLKGSDIGETVKNIYHYVIKEIDLSGKMMFHPDSADDTLYRRGGSSEDRAILARAVLKHYNISSFLAFTRNRFLPQDEKYISPEHFTHILLYVPLERDNGIWLDFSQDANPCGVVNGALLNTRALVLFRTRAEYKVVTAKCESVKKARFTILVDERGNTEIDAGFVFSGSYRSIVEYFKDVRYHEETIHSLAGSIFPSIDVAGFTIKNVDKQEAPIEVFFKGVEPNGILAGSGKMVLQPIVNKSDVYGYIQYPRKYLDLIIDESIDEEEEYDYSLPEMYKSAKISQEHEIKSPYGVARIRIRKDEGSLRLLVEKKIKIYEGIIKPQDYEEFLQFCLKIKDVEFQNIILVRD